MKTIASIKSNRRYCILWSGGKDSFLALTLAIKTFSILENDLIFVTFVPSTGLFLCHPLGLLQLHSEFWRAPHKFIVIDTDDWKPAYERAFRCLVNLYGIEFVITGDIIFRLEGFADYWLGDILSLMNIKLILTLANYYAEELLEYLAELEIVAIVTGVRDAYYHRRFLGGIVSLQLIQAVSDLADHSFDLCGERGEYHTTVVRYGSHVFYSPGELDLQHQWNASIWSLRLNPVVLSLSAPRFDVSKSEY